MWLSPLNWFSILDQNLFIKDLNKTLEKVCLFTLYSKSSHLCFDATFLNLIIFLNGIKANW